MSIPADIKQSAQTALERIGGEAAVLFGSRARHDWRSTSDWDIALIMSKGFQLDERLFDNVRKNGHVINFAVVSDEVLRERSCYVGSLHRAIVRDGIVVAGEYDLKTLDTGILQMDIELFANHMSHARMRIRSAAESFARLMEGVQDKADDLADCAGFVSDSADAAERLAKGLLMKLGIDPEQTHNMHALSEQAANAGYQKEASLLASINGNTKLDHVAHYEIQDALIAGCRRAGGRYGNVLILYADMMASLPSHAYIDESKQHKAALDAFELVEKSFKYQFTEMNDRLPEVMSLLNQRETIYTYVQQARDRHKSTIENNN